MLSFRFIEYAKAMQRVEDAGVNSKSAADKILAEVEPVSLILFLVESACWLTKRLACRNYQSDNSSSQTA